MVRFLLKNTKLFVLCYLFTLSFFSVFKSVVSLDTFEENNFPVYDGVIYEYQQIKRYLKFNGDFSITSRYSQAIYEFESNPVSGIYNSLLIFISPTLLINDWDIYIRSFVGVFLLFFALYSYLNRINKPIWSLMFITILSCLPLFFHFRVGLGTYVPELISGVYLLAGYLLLLQFIDNKRRIYFVFGIVAFFIPILFRYNFFAYVSLLSIPILVKLIFQFSSFSRKQWMFILSVGMPWIAFLLYVIFFHFGSFYYYYTTVCYAIVSIPQSLEYLYGNLFDFYGLHFLILLPLLFVGNSIFRISKAFTRREKVFQLIEIVFPFFIYFVFIVFIMKSTNTPHLMSILTLYFLICLSLFRIPIRSTVIPSKTQILLITSYFLIVIYLNVSDLNKIKHTKPLDQYQAQKEVVNYVQKYHVKSLFTIFDSMQEIPTNVSLYSRGSNFVFSSNVYFSLDAYLKGSCQSITNCTESYIHTIDQTDLVVINQSENANYVEPMSRQIRAKLRNYLATSKIHYLASTLFTKHYGNLLFYVKNK